MANASPSRPARGRARPTGPSTSSPDHPGKRAGRGGGTAGRTSAMSRPTSQRRRPGIHIPLARAARLHRLVTILARGPEAREGLLSELGIGLRTFYRELELL